MALTDSQLERYSRYVSRASGCKPVAQGRFTHGDYR